MPYWVYGAGLVAVLVVIAALKADYGMRVIATIAVVAGMLWYALGRKK